MVAWGAIGLIAGGAGELLKRHKWLLLIFGVLAGFFYSAVMDVWTVLWYDDSFSIELYLVSVVSALPHTMLYSISNFAFLYFLAKPFGEKLERVKMKYGI